MTPSRKQLTQWRNASLAAIALAGCLGHVAQAQTLYRIVGPDGRVTFTDKPPAPSQGTAVTGAGGRAVSSGASLPFELRQVASKYPVTLYTANNCPPCGSGRTLLMSRGIPFTERTVNTPEDTEALIRISGENSLPFLTIGGQQIKGYADSEWTQFLDAAGYPKTSVLPSSYRQAPATALVTVQKPAAAASAAESAATAARPAAATRPAAPTPNTPSNPAGITF